MRGYAVNVFNMGVVEVKYRSKHSAATAELLCRRYRDRRLSAMFPATGEYVGAHSYHTLLADLRYLTDSCGIDHSVALSALRIRPQRGGRLW